jgi:CBS-domain-containing membrane protein
VNVQDLMTRSVRCCSPRDTLSAAARILWENDCGCVPVRDGEGRVVAMLTDRDICMAAYTRGRALADLRVSDAMSAELHAVGPEESLPRAQRVMQEQQVRRLPVVDDAGQLLGVLSLNDLVCEAVRDPSRRGRDGVSLEGVALTLAAVSRPRAPRERRETRQAEARGQRTAEGQSLAGAA